MSIFGVVLESANTPYEKVRSLVCWIEATKPSKSPIMVLKLSFYLLIKDSMTKLLQKAFQEAQKLSENLQDEIAQQLLADIENELKWQETLANSDLNLDILRKMAQSALIEDQEGKTEEKGFGEE